jgi:hypothetical protein
MDTELIETLTVQIDNLKKQLNSCQHEQDRLRYMTTGYLALILETKDVKLIKRARTIADAADKLE